MKDEIVIIETGLANVASLTAAFNRLGLEVVLSSDAELVVNALRVVLPGVGAFAAGMSFLKQRQLVEPLRERIAKRKATLAICLGLQLLCSSSEESPGVAGLGILPLEVKRFPESVAVPQIGWNRVEPESEQQLVQGAEMYFANSYYLGESVAGWKVSRGLHGVEFVAAVEDGGVLGCQFHAELSGEAGKGLLGRWIETGGQA